MTVRLWELFVSSLTTDYTDSTDYLWFLAEKNLDLSGLHKSDAVILKTSFGLTPSHSCKNITMFFQDFLRKGKESRKDASQYGELTKNIKNRFRQSLSLTVIDALFVSLFIKAYF